MDFSLPEDLLAMQRAVREFARAELAPVATELDRAPRFPWETLRKMGELGLLGMLTPEEYGGAGLDTLSYVVLLEEIAAVDASHATIMSVTNGLPQSMLLKHGTEAQRQRYLPRLASGEWIGAFCLSEPHAGSDPAAMTTRARRDGDHYILDGVKAWITHGGQADFYTVMARTSDDRSRGISCFLVPADTPGLSADRPERKMGLTASHTTMLRFDGVRIPADQRIGAEGQGLSIALSSLDAGRLGIAAVATGLAQAALDTAVDYARQREAFGKPIIEHQGLAFLLADMAAAVETARAATLRAARLKDSGLPYSKEASIAKLIATDNAMRVTTDAVQVLGGYGYTRDFPVERYMREAKVMQIFEGTNQIQRLVIGRHLARDATAHTVTVVR